MSNLSSPERATVAKLLGLIGSQHDAEALAAARKAHELIRQRGATWRDLLQAEAETPAADPAPAHVTTAQKLLAQGRGTLTKWERDFLIGIMAFKIIKPKQQEILTALQLKIDVANSDKS